MREFRNMSVRKRTALKGAAPDTSPMALLIMDMISDFEFEDGPKLYPAALRVAGRIQRLRQRAKARGIPVIYVNDNFGRWRSDLRELVEHCAQDQMLGSAVVRRLLPEHDDYFVLKPRHSGFFATPLETLLEHIRVQQVIVTGVSTNQCILFTANDAYVRGYRLAIPRDCIAAPEP